jgi:hypothetical protein
MAHPVSQHLGGILAEDGSVTLALLTWCPHLSSPVNHLHLPALKIVLDRIGVNTYVGVNESDRAKKGMLLMAADEKKPKGSVKESRIGKRAVTAWVDPEIFYSLRVIAAERRITQQELLVEALNDCLEKHGKPRIEEEPQTKN